MMCLIIVFVILLVISFVLVFLLFQKGDQDQLLDKSALVDDPKILFEDENKSDTNEFFSEEDEEII